MEGRRNSQIHWRLEMSIKTGPRVTVNLAHSDGTMATLMVPLNEPK
jgi:hypothetical protein